jgi:hypothetical protein
MRRLFVPVAVLALGLGCDAAEGTFEGDLIDCTWFADATNCWATAVTEAAACTDSTTAGVFAEDRTSCVYANGAQVNFEEALPEDLSNTGALLAHNWNSEVLSQDGQSCAKLNTSSLGAVDLSVASGSFSMALVGLAGLQFTCPDGSKYYMEADIDDVAGSLDSLSCLDFPGANVVETADGGVSLSLNAPAGLEDTEVFTCELPEEEPSDTGAPE